MFSIWGGGYAGRGRPLLAAHAARQKLRDPRIIRHESVSLLTTVAAVEGDSDRAVLFA